MISGKCHCGDVTYKAKSESPFQFLCHCNSCRKINGGGHLSGAIFNKEDFEYAGPAKLYEYAGGSGELIKSYFCEKCGNHLFAFPTYKDDIVVVKANTFDDEQSFKPMQSIFTEEAFHWDKAIL